jgi:vacuolar-type H+-ATPase subunit H
MDVLHMVDRLETMLSKGWRIPFTSNVVIREDAFLDIIDQIRGSIPDEVKQAKRLGADRERILEQAHQEAERIVAMAHEQVDALASNQEVVRQAERRAQEISVQANQSAEIIRSDAEGYVVEVLGNLEEELLQLITTVRNGIHKLERAPASSSRAAESQTRRGSPEDGG